MTADDAAHVTIDTRVVDGGAVGGPRTPPPAISQSTPKLPTRVAEYGARHGEIDYLAETLNDIEHLRIATENRARQLATIGLDSAFLDALADELHKTEHKVELALGRAARRHPLGPWLKTAPGIGPKQGPRLLAAIGNPYWNARDNRPRRGPAELWAYCGYHVLPANDHVLVDDHAPRVVGGHPSANTDHVFHDTHGVLVGVGLPSHPNDQCLRDTHSGIVVGVAPRKQKGQLANWNTQARTRTWLIATSCVQQPNGTRYRDTYTTARTKYATATHATTCQQCSTCHNCHNPLTKTRKDHLNEHGCNDRRPEYAGPGTPLTAGHQHARALRIVAKTILKDIYLAAQTWHQTEENEP